MFTDQAMRIRMHDLDSATTLEVDKDLWRYHGELEDFRVSWSSDSHWFTYSRGIENSNEAIFIYDVANKKGTQVTSGYYNDNTPAFDPDGKYLYFVSGREFRPIYSDLDPTWIYANTSKILAVPLRANVKSPLAARNNEEKPRSDEPKKEETPKSKSVEIEFADFERRAIELPIPSGRYAQLQAIEGKILYLRLSRTGAGERGARSLFSMTSTSARKKFSKKAPTRLLSRPIARGCSSPAAAPGTSAELAASASAAGEARAARRRPKKIFPRKTSPRSVSATCN